MWGEVWRMWRSVGRGVGKRVGGGVEVWGSVGGGVGKCVGVWGR